MRLTHNDNLFTNIADPEVKKLQNKGINVNSWIVGERKRTRKKTGDEY